MRLDVVTALYWPDIDRFMVLLKSMKRFWKIEGNHFAVVPHHEQKKIAERLSGTGVKVVSENDIVRNEARLLPGWWSQQTRKIGACKLVESDFYINIDADTFLLRDVCYDDLIKDGRGGVILLRSEVHQEWYEWVRKTVLKLDSRPAESLLASTFLFSTMLMRSLIEHLEKRWSKPWEVVLAETRIDKSHVGQNTWTEGTLYHSHAVAIGEFDRYHFKFKDGLFVGCCAWLPKDVQDWSAERAFKSGHFFCVVQSHLGLSASWVWERIKTFTESVPARVSTT